MGDNFIKILLKSIYYGKKYKSKIELTTKNYNDYRIHKTQESNFIFTITGNSYQGKGFKKITN